jgi:tetratricopeptide (TPR) repeat protein
VSFDPAWRKYGGPNADLVNAVLRDWKLPPLDLPPDKLVDADVSELFQQLEERVAAHRKTTEQLWLVLDQFPAGHQNGLGNDTDRLIQYMAARTAFHDLNLRLVLLGYERKVLPPGSDAHLVVLDFLREEELRQHFRDLEANIPSDPGAGDADPLQVMFNRVLAGKPIDVDTLTEDELIQLEQVATWLHGLPVGQELGVPDPAAVCRHLAFLRLVKPLAERAPAPFVVHATALNCVERFIHRDTPVAPPPLVIWGKPGVGKSALAARVALEFLGAYPASDLRRSAFSVRRTADRDGRSGPVVFLDLGTRTLWPDLPRRLLEETARQLAAQTARPDESPAPLPPATTAADSAAEKAAREAGVAALQAYCQEHWGSRLVLLLVDGYDHVLEAGETMHDQVWSLMTALTGRLPTARVLVIGHYPPGARALRLGEGVTQSDYKTSDPSKEAAFAEHLELTGLDEEESDSLLQQLGVPWEVTPTIRKWAGGNPRTLRRAAEAYRHIAAKGMPPDLVEAEYRRRWGIVRPSGGPGPVTLPAPPDPYVAHPYLLLQTERLVGRRDELEGLTRWATDPAAFGGARVLCVCASGGMGKSALTWHWFQHVAPEAIDRLQGRIWWSFYDADADLETFVTRALAYMSRQPVEAVAARPFADQIDALFDALDESRYLVVLDGFERQLVAYARLDKGAVDTDDDLDRKAGNQLAEPYRLTARGRQGAGAAGPVQKPNQLRAGTFQEACRRFLLRLPRVRQSRVLVSTRLFPADFQEETGETLSGVAACDLGGLANADAHDLWRELGCHGEGHELAEWFSRFQNYPLLIQALAGGVYRDYEARGDFNKWRERHPDFDPFVDPEFQKVRNQILVFAIQSLPSRESLVLAHLAMLRMATGFETLQAILVGPTGVLNSPEELRQALTHLSERSLVGQSQANLRYDVHPVVRGVAAAQLQGAKREDVLSRLSTYYSKFPRLENPKGDPQAITPHLEYYFLLIRQERWDAAYEQFKARLGHVTRNVFGLMRDRLEWLKELFEGQKIANQLRVTRPDLRGHAFYSVAETLIFLSRFDRAVDVLERALREAVPDLTLETNLQRTLAYALHAEARFAEAELSVKRSLLTARAARDVAAEARSLMYLTWVYLEIGDRDRAEPAYRRARRLFEQRQETSNTALLDSEMFLETNRLGEAERAAAVLLADAENTGYEFGIAVGHARCGVVALRKGDLDGAERHFDEARRRSVSGGFAYKETDILISLGRWWGAKPTASNHPADCSTQRSASSRRPCFAHRSASTALVLAAS